jgi:hypothetical protein
MKKASSDALARSVTDRLRNVATKTKSPFDAMQALFLLERMAVRRASHAKLSRQLVFKGGYVSIRVYQSPRYTTDLDAVLTKGDLISLRDPVVACVEADIGDGVWFRFEETQDLTTQGEYGGLRIVFRAGIGPLPEKLVRARAVTLDIGTGDPITPGAKEEVTPTILGEGSLSWKVYPVETICSEKLHTLVVRGSESSRAKDIFDLNLLLPRCDQTMLLKALSETFRFRGDSMPGDVYGHLSSIDRTRLRAGWHAAVGGIAGAGNFSDAFETLLAQIKKVFRGQDRV